MESMFWSDSPDWNPSPELKGFLEELIEVMMFCFKAGQEAGESEKLMREAFYRWLEDLPERYRSEYIYGLMTEDGRAGILRKYPEWERLNWSQKMA